MLKQKSYIFTPLFLISIITVGAAVFLYWYSSLPKFPGRGGTVTEGVVGQPHLINPLYSDWNPIDRELCSLLFRGLVKYDSYNQPVSDLAQGWEIKENGKVYEVELKENQYWHDGRKVSVDDVVFTYQLTQNEAYLGPERKTFEEVEIEKVDDIHLKLTLKDTFSPFLENLTLGILPAHLWQNINLEDLTRHPLNLKPVGSGPAHFNRLIFNTKIENWLDWLEFDLPDAYLKKLRFKFYPNEVDLITALKLGEIDTAVLNNYADLDKFEKWPNYVKRALPIWGQSMVLLYNLRNEKLSDGAIRQALAGALINPISEEDSKSALEMEAYRVRAFSPVPRKSWAYTEVEKVISVTETDLPEKLVIKTPYDPVYQEIAGLVKRTWEQKGVSVEIELLDKIGFEETLREYDFEVLLITQESGHEPDQYIYWHSSQKTSPGLNLTGVTHAKLDKALENGRKTGDLDERKEAYREFIKYFQQTLPAVFLYHPNLYYLTSARIKSLNLHNLWLPENRFANINEWYLKESRPIF
ncbi:hypothetical protein KKB83_00270 [Patescibacteria group bacterium]|nr:hypothetical protein [Patescibacteria group bacterium]